MGYCGSHHHQQVELHRVKGPKMHDAKAPGGPLKHHHWQALACLIADHRADWAVEDILDKLALCQELQSYPDLARTALTVALDPAHKTPAAIHFAAAGLLN